MHIYYEQNFFRSNSKGELIGFTEFLSNTGGLLGLFLGFSVVSLIEILYFLTFRPYCVRNRHDNNNNNNKLEKLRRKRNDSDMSEVVQTQRHEKVFKKIKRKELDLFRPEIVESWNGSHIVNRYQYFEWEKCISSDINYVVEMTVGLHEFRILLKFLLCFFVTFFVTYSFTIKNKWRFKEIQFSFTHFLEHHSIGRRSYEMCTYRGFAFILRNYIIFIRDSVLVETSSNFYYLPVKFFFVCC